MQIKGHLWITLKCYRAATRITSIHFSSTAEEMLCSLAVALINFYLLCSYYYWQYTGTGCPSAALSHSVAINFFIRWVVHFISTTLLNWSPQSFQFVSFLPLSAPHPSTGGPFKSLSPWFVIIFRCTPTRPPLIFSIYNASREKTNKTGKHIQNLIGKQMTCLFLLLSLGLKHMFTDSLYLVSTNKTILNEEIKVIDRSILYGERYCTNCQLLL